MIDELLVVQTGSSVSQFNHEEDASVSGDAADVYIL